MSSATEHAPEVMEIENCRQSSSSKDGDESASDVEMPILIPQQLPPPSTPTTPSSAMATTPGSSLNTPNTTKKRKRDKLTPDERANRERERAEKRQKLEEERVRKEEEKRRREAERAEKARAKEAERLAKEAERLAKEAERAEKTRQKEAERLEREKVKEAERMAKETERLKKEAELAKRSEEKRAKEAEELAKKAKEEEKKAKQANFFTQFFSKSPAATHKPPKVLDVAKNINTASAAESLNLSDKENDDSSSATAAMASTSTVSEGVKERKVEGEVEFDDTAELQIVLVKKTEGKKFSPMPFQIKKDMAVAPLLRRDALNFDERQFLEKIWSQEIHPLENYPKWGKEKRKSGRTMVSQDPDDYEENEVTLLMEDLRPSLPKNCKRWRMKLLQFSENRRPAYWGTCKKPTTAVRPRRPWAHEEEIDYEFDSDDEWEDEPEDAEEIENSDGEEDPPETVDGEPVDEEDEEGWMVPHGYLSDSERNADEGEQDLDLIKIKEKEFFNSLKEQVKMGLPVIQTNKLSTFATVFPPEMTRKVRRSQRERKETKESKYPPSGFLSLAYPSDDESDDESWNMENGEKNLREKQSETDKNSSSESNSDSDDSEDSSSPEGEDEGSEFEEENGSKSGEECSEVEGEENEGSAEAEEVDKDVEMETFETSA